MSTGLDVGEVNSPATARVSQRKKAQQALTKYVRHDSSRTGVQARHPKPANAADDTQSPSLLNVKPVKAGQSIAAALSRQAGKALPKGIAVSAMSQASPAGQLKARSTGQ